MTPAAASGEVPEPLERLRERHGDVYVIVSPPRCSSTAMARILWEHPSVRFYCHEPFEVTYYEGLGLDAVTAKLEAALDLARLTSRPPAPGAQALVIKEMPYQVGDRFPLLAALATRPLLFLIRDPRSSISSRMRKKREAGDEPLFPQIETGWELLRRQVAVARSRGVPYAIVDTSEVRNDPLAVLPRLLDVLGLEFSPQLLDWRPCPRLELDNLGGRHRHLYRRVLESDRLEPALREPPGLESFPQEAEWREHVAKCLDIYRELSEERIQPPERSAGANEVTPAASADTSTD